MGSGGRDSPLIDGVQGSAEGSFASGFQGAAIRPLIHGSVQVERDVSKPCEWLTGDTVCWLWSGLNALKEPWAEGGLTRIASVYGDLTRPTLIKRCAERALEAHGPIRRETDRRGFKRSETD